MQWTVLRDRGKEEGSWPNAAAIGTISRTASRSDVLFRSNTPVTFLLNSSEDVTPSSVCFCRICSLFAGVSW